MFSQKQGVQSTQPQDEDAPRLKKLLKNLEPEHKHLEEIQAKRVGYAISILNANVKLATIAAALCNDISKGKEGATSFSDDILKHANLSKEMTGRFFEISERFRENVRLEIPFKSSLRRVSDKIKGESSKSLESDTVISKDTQTLIEVLNSFWKIARERLLTSPKEENRRLEYLNTVLSRARRSHDAIVTLNNQLQESVKDKNDHISVLDFEIKKLMSDLETASTNAQDEHDRISSEAAKQISSEGKIHDKNAFCLLEEIHALQQNLRSIRNDHYREETYLRKKTYKLRTELHNWISKYDQDLEWRQDEIDELLELQALNRSDLKILEEQVSKLEVQYNKIMEERRIKVEERERLMKELKTKVGAALKIQSLWRGYVVRRILRGRYQPGGNKGKDKKGKKKNNKK